MTSTRETIRDTIERLKPLSEFEREQELVKMDASVALFITHALRGYDETKDD